MVCAVYCSLQCRMRSMCPAIGSGKAQDGIAEQGLQAFTFEALVFNLVHLQEVAKAQTICNPMSQGE